MKECVEATLDVYLSGVYSEDRSFWGLQNIPTPLNDSNDDLIPRVQASLFPHIMSVPLPGRLVNTIG